MSGGRKKALLSVLILCLLSGSAVFGAEPEVRQLDLKDAVTLALERNSGIQLATLDWEQARTKLERAQIVGDAEMLTEAESEWGKLDKRYGEQKQELENLVRISYQQLLESEIMVENAHTAKTRAEDQLAIDKNKYEVGLLSTLDIERAQNSLFDAAYRYEKSRIDLKTQQMNFNELLGLPLEQEVALTERLLLDFVPFTLGLETCYERAFELDADLSAAQETLQKANGAVLLAQGPLTPKVELEKAMINVEKAQIQLHQAEQALYFRIRGDYYALFEQAHNLEVRARHIELERQSLKAEQSKYAAGVVSNAQIVAKQEELAGLEQQYSADLLAYSLARLKLLQAIGEHGQAWGADDEN